MDQGDVLKNVQMSLYHGGIKQKPQSYLTRKHLIKMIIKSNQELITKVLAGVHRENRASEACLHYGRMRPGVDGVTAGRPQEATLQVAGEPQLAGGCTWELRCQELDSRQSSAKPACVCSHWESHSEMGTGLKPRLQDLQGLHILNVQLGQSH
jgi:hypothetical protein